MPLPLLDLDNTLVDRAAAFGRWAAGSRHHNRHLSFLELSIPRTGYAQKVHSGYRYVPAGLAAKPVIDILVSVPDVNDEQAYLAALESAGLVLRLRESGHRFLWPPRGMAREVHVHVGAAGGAW